MGLLSEMTDGDLKTMLEDELEIKKPGHRMKCVLLFLLEMRRSALHTPQR